MDTKYPEQGMGVARIGLRSGLQKPQAGITEKPNPKRPQCVAIDNKDE
jgi:hypothetical protein